MSEAAAGADPERAVCVDEQRADEVVGQTVGGGVGADCASANAVEAVGSADPQVTIRGGGEGQNHVAGEAVAHRVNLDLADASAAAGDGVQAAADGADPQRAGVVFDDCGCG